MAVCDIPDYEFENLARSFLPAMQKYFQARREWRLMKSGCQNRKKKL